MDVDLTTRVEITAERDVAHIVHLLTRHRQLEETKPVVVVSGQGAEVTLNDGRMFVITEDQLELAVNALRAGIEETSAVEAVAAG
jgi:hypothetical protein